MCFTCALCVILLYPRVINFLNVKWRVNRKANSFEFYLNSNKKLRVLKMDEIEFNNNYIIEEPLEFEPDHRGLGYLFFNCMKRYKENVAQYLEDTGEEDTYDDLLTRVIRTALELKTRNLDRKDVVALCSYNQKNSIVPFIACTFLGLQVASLDPILSVMDITHLLSEVKPKIIFTVPEVMEVIEEALEEAGLNAEIVFYDELGIHEEHTSFSDFLQPKEGEEDFVPEPISSLQDTAVIFFSSGTTGYPKGILINHYALICQAIIVFKSGNLGKVFISYASLYWISSVLMTTAVIFVGAAKVICHNFDPAQFWQLIEKYKIATMATSPSQAVDLIKSGRPDNLDTSSFVSCIVGGATITEKQILMLRDLLPGTFVAMAYGQTEVAGIITFFQINKVEHTLGLHHKPESVGKVVPGMMCKVVDQETGKICGPNETGELLLKSALVMNGYYGKDSSESFDSDGWLKTGDVVYYDEEKFFFVVDRIKEMLKYKSWHVPPAVVEKLVLDHPAVQKVVVIGVPHEEDGDHPMAVIILNPNFTDTVTEDDIQEFVAEKAPDRMRLRGGVKFVSSIPFTPSGKVKRQYVRDMVLNGLV